MSDHSPLPPLPWAKDNKHVIAGAVRVRAADGAPVAEIWWTNHDTEATADLIVTAVNSHAELVEALQTLVDALPEDGEWGHFLDIKQHVVALLTRIKGD